MLIPHVKYQNFKIENYDFCVALTILFRINFLVSLIFVVFVFLLCSRLLVCESAKHLCRFMRVS